MLSSVPQTATDFVLSGVACFPEPPSSFGAASFPVCRDIQPCQNYGPPEKLRSGRRILCAEESCDAGNAHRYSGKVFASARVRSCEKNFALPTSATSSDQLLSWPSFVVEICNKWTCLHLTKIACAPILRRTTVPDGTMSRRKFACLESHPHPLSPF